jgi:hypothetical protein
MFDRYNTIDAEDTAKGISQIEGFLASVAQNVAQIDENGN